MSGRIVAGLIIILVGIGLLLDARGTIDFGDTFSTYWPLILVAIGVGLMASRPHSMGGGVVLLVLGCVFLARNLDYLPNNWFSYVWPVLLILVGILLLVPRAHRSRAHRMDGPAPPPPNVADIDAVHMSAFFGGSDEIVRSQAFKGGKIDVVFAGAKLDLTGAKLAMTGGRLDVSAVFGGIEIIVPRDWNVVVNARPVLGGVENKTVPVPPTGSPGPVLEVNATAAFGGVKIRN